MGVPLRGLELAGRGRAMKADPKELAEARWLIRRLADRVEAMIRYQCYHETPQRLAEIIGTHVELAAARRYLAKRRKGAK